MLVDAWPINQAFTVGSIMKYIVIASLFLASCTPITQPPIRIVPIQPEHWPSARDIERAKNLQLLYKPCIYGKVNMRNPFKRNNQYTVTSEELAAALNKDHPTRDGVYVEFTIKETNGKRRVVRTQVKKHRK